MLRAQVLDLVAACATLRNFPVLIIGKSLLLMAQRFLGEGLQLIAGWQRWSTEGHSARQRCKRAMPKPKLRRQGLCARSSL